MGSVLAVIIGLVFGALVSIVQKRNRRLAFLIVAAFVIAVAIVLLTNRLPSTPLCLLFAMSMLLSAWILRWVLHSHAKSSPQ